MGLVKKLLSGWGMSPRRSQPHAVLVHLELIGGKYGSEDEVEEIRLLGDDCDEAVRAAAVGEFEGEEFGDAECVLVFSGPDAELLWNTISPLLRVSRLSRGGHVIQRFGGPAARQVRLAISP